eukprot:CFRG1645T1
MTLFTEPNFCLALCKPFRHEHIQDVASLGVEALENIGDAMAKAWAELGVTTIRDLAEYKYGRWATSLLTLSKFQGSTEGDILGTKCIQHMLNLDEKHESLGHIVAADVTVLMGLGEKKKHALNRIGILTVRDLAEYSFFETAIALVEMAEAESIVRKHEQLKAEEKDPTWKPAEEVGEKREADENIDDEHVEKKQK